MEIARQPLVVSRNWKLTTIAIAKQIVNFKFGFEMHVRFRKEIPLPGFSLGDPQEEPGFLLGLPRGNLVGEVFP